MATIYASFNDPALAEKAAGALLDYGVRSEDISVIAHEKYGTSRATGTMFEDRASATVDPAYSDRIVADVDNAAVSSDYNTTVVDRNIGTDPIDRDDSVVTRDRATDESHIEGAAKGGISTTTPGDAASGAVKGAGIGLGVGVMAALAALMVPGFGLVLGGGALATAIAGAAGATAAGAVAGGTFGYLKDQGVPDEVATEYNKAFESGGAILAVNVPSGDVDSATAETVLAKYGANNVGSYGATPV